MESGTKESLSKTLNGYLGDIAARKKLVDVLDKDIWNQVDPLRICQDDTATLKKLMSRYAALREDEKKLLQNGESLLEAADVIEALDNGIVPKKVFENLMATKEAFTYTGTLSGGSTYTLTWDGKTVKKASDVKAGIKIGTGSNTINGTQAQVEFSQSGSMNGTVTLSVKTSVKDGSWNLYWLNPDKLTIQSAKTATVSSGKLKMSVTTGGRYWLASSAPKMGRILPRMIRPQKSVPSLLRKAAVKATAPEACQLQQSRAGEKYLLQVEREVQVQKQQ